MLKFSKAINMKGRIHTTIIELELCIILMSFIMQYIPTEDKPQILNWQMLIFSNQFSQVTHLFSIRKKEKKQ